MRTKATFASFVLVFALYFVYGWCLVPFVLPNPSHNNDKTIKIDPKLYEQTRNEIAPLLELLPENDWENDTEHPIHVLQFKQTVLLFGNDSIEGNRITLKPCTILILPDDVDYHNEVSKEQLLQSVIFRAPESTEVQFDRDFDIGKLPLPEIVEARLFGKVTVAKGSRGSGKQDDFYLATEVVKITETPGLTKIETERKVEFNLGFHSGVGVGLVLEIAQSNPGATQEAKQLRSASFQRLQSLHLVFPEDPNAAPKFSGGVYVPDGPATTIDSRCQGNFVFAVNPAEKGWTASFFQNVEMERTNPDKKVDRLTAEQVRLTLTPDDNKKGTTVAENKTSQFDGLEPTLFVAQGKVGQGTQPAVPARLTSQQNGGITLVGDEIFLDLRKNFVSLSTRKGAGGSPHVEMFLAEQFRIRSEQSIQYTFGKDGAFGRFASEGKGNLTGKTGEGAAAKDVFLTWNAMQIAPNPTAKDQIAVKLSKGVTAKMTGIGTMAAGTLDLVCKVTPSNQASQKQSTSPLPGMSGQKSDFLLDSAVVKENVVLSTESGTCKVNQLTILFTHVLDGKVQHSQRIQQYLTTKPPVAPSVRSMFAQRIASDGVVLASAPIPSGIPGIQQVQHLQSLPPLSPQQVSAVTTPVYGSRTPQQQPSSRPAPGSVETQNLLGIKSSPNSGPFAITGDQMKMEVRLQDGQSSAQVVAIEGNVQLKETPLPGTPTPLPGTPGAAIEITGHTVTIWNPSEPTTKITILGHATGGDAVFKGKGIELCTQELHISRPDNKFWSPGAGRLTAYAAQAGVPGMPSTNANSPLTVDWNKEMVCDGLVLQFVGEAGTKDRVKTKYQTQMLWCNVMEILLNRRVMFFDDSSPVEPKALEIKCSGNVCARNEQFGVQGKRQSIDTAKDIANLHYDIEKQYFIAEGPGEMSSIFVGSGQGFDKTAQSGNFAGTPGAENLNFLGIWFLTQMQGTLLDHNKKVDIRGKVEAVYCPATTWNDTIAREHFSAARKTGYLLECERLQIVEVLDPLNMSQSSMELTAMTNAVIDGSGIFASAQTIMYNQAKNTIHMNKDVKLQRWGQSGVIEVEAIMYNVENGNVDFMQTKGLGLGQ